ncbi:hypothetical protein A8F94_16265 [Bacillus sp. FJAT-27225]|uniref:DUF2268 domain-containing protein n=1 Tax=Bacillus sp. FJAT-27225 TaxID=1743144 RepID=UPI00080C2A94|nr:DUF2268 domain-containing putative Zn-dependent protease [Bacillus sp. FJAT-27225]OCA84267.1 hypothetical protein A8F94_16265 [Bacillus sp. FJAT-27225]
MGVINTDEWLKKDGNNLNEICRKLQSYYPEKDHAKIQRELAHFGMYRTYPGVKEDIDRLTDRKEIWEWAQEFLEIYMKKWEGPEIPLFIFPVANKKHLFRKETMRKSGVAYKDKLFLFLPNDIEKKELKAIFVHEYHHVCRMNFSEGKIEENTLMDSMVMEGLAEHAVLAECGEGYLAEWSKKYPDWKTEQMWKEFFQHNLNLKKKDRSHDRLLFGGGRIPALAGYSVGFWLVKNYYHKRKFDVKNSFKIKKISFFP